MELPTVRKCTYTQHILVNKNTHEYYDGKGHTTSELLKCEKYNGYSKASKSRDEMDNPNDWGILKVKTSCEILESCEEN